MKLDSLTKYENYDDDRLVQEFTYLCPWESDPWDGAERLQEMDETDLAHLYAVMQELKRRVNDGD